MTARSWWRTSIPVGPLGVSQDPSNLLEGDPRGYALIASTAWTGTQSTGRHRAGPWEGAANTITQGSKSRGEGRNTRKNQPKRQALMNEKHGAQCHGGNTRTFFANSSSSKPPANLHNGVFTAPPPATTTSPAALPAPQRQLLATPSIGCPISTIIHWDATAWPPRRCTSWWWWWQN